MQQLPNPMLAVGCDSSKDTLEVVMLVLPEQVVWQGTIENRPAGYRELAKAIGAQGERLDLSPVVGVEDQESYSYGLVRFLRRQGVNVVTINPRQTSRQRDFYGPDKTDHLDARCLAAILLRAQDLTSPQPVAEQIEALDLLQREHERLVAACTLVTNQLHHELTRLYPGYQRHFPNAVSATALAVWQRSPTPAHLCQIDVPMLSALIHQASRGRYRQDRSDRMAEAFLQEYRRDGPAVDSPVLAAQAVVVTSLVVQLCTLQETHRKVVCRMQALLAETPQTLTTLPGLGVILAATILGQTHSAERFDNDRNRYARYNGTAPEERSSGRRQRHHPARWCNHRLKWAFYQLARLQVQHRVDPAVDYYQRQIERGKNSHQAYKLLARRLSDIVFAMLRDGTPYQLPVPAT